MTKRLVNPSKRGKKPASHLVRRLLLRRWEKFELDHPIAGSQITAEARAELFLKLHSLWLAEYGLRPNGGQQLRNWVSKGRKARAADVASRKWMWQIAQNGEGRNRIDPLARYKQIAAMFALSIRK